MLVVLIVTGVLIGLVQGEACDQENCNLPDCRCFSDVTSPGGLEALDIPQMVIITMDYVLNSELREGYESIFVVNNPNGCPIRGTFFIQDRDTNYDVVKAFYDTGFEIGINSLTGISPGDSTEWIEEIKAIKDKLLTLGLDEKDIVGYRAPSLSPGGTEMFIGIAEEELLYDASCVSSEYAAEDTFKFPFTYDYDFDNGQVQCNGGSSVDVQFPGRWQILMGQLEFNGEKCASPQSCINVNDKEDAFDLLYQNFERHYQGNRSPFTVVVDPVWMKTDFKVEGLIEFVEYVRAAYDDVWVVTQHQAVQWVQNPTPIANLTDFEPFQCQTKKNVIL